MAHAQKPDFVFRRNGRVHLNRRGASVQPTAGSQGVRISGSNAGYTMFRGSVKSTGYPLHSPVSPSLPLPCVTVCHHVPAGLNQGYLLAGKGDRCVGLTDLPSSYAADSLEFWESQTLGTFRACAGLSQLKCDGTRAETRFRLSAKRTSPFKSAGASVQSTTGSRGVCISGSNAGYTTFRGSVKGTGYPLHSPV